MTARRVFPFDGVVGQDDAKLALRLAAADPLIGGVLLRGEKGSGKTTLARGLAALLGHAPFAELPVGATEDRVVGTLDTRAALAGGEWRFDPGVLAAAHGGVLYVDEINLLPDHLVDVLLDVAVSGENVVERDGISHRHPARFVLVGSMNPEEGELRPQLLDRFGLCVEVAASHDVADRALAVRRRLAFDAGTPGSGAAVTGTLRESPTDPLNPRSGQPMLLSATTWADQNGRSGVPDELVEAAARLALAAGAEGLRADLTLCRSAAALATLDGRAAPTTDDLVRVAPLVLAHRSRRGPFDPPVLSAGALDDALRAAGLASADDDDDDAADQFPAGEHRDGGSSPEGSPDAHDPADSSPPRSADEPFSGDQSRPGSDAAPGGGAGDAGRGDRPGRQAPVPVGEARAVELPRPETIRSPRGRVVGDAPAGPADRVTVLPSLRSAVSRGAVLDVAAPASGPSRVENADLRTSVRVKSVARVIVVCVDVSGSMGAAARAEAATGTVLGLLGRAYQQRDKVGLVTFGGDGARAVLMPTSSIEVARNRLADLVVGGVTPLADGLTEARRVAEQTTRDPECEPLLVLLTDGRASGPGGFDAAIEVAAAIGRAGIDSLVLDCETGPRPLGLAQRLAVAMGARHESVADLEMTTLVRSISGGD